MNHKVLSTSLYEVHDTFAHRLEEMSDLNFVGAPEGKWTPGQHGEHLNISIKILNKAMKLPLFLMKWKFGVANRPSRTYEELKARYHERLTKADKAPAKFAPKEVALSKRASLCASLRLQAKKLSERYAKLNNKQLDTVIVSHPLMGYLTLREMGFFMIYHVGLHQQSIH